MIHTSGLAGLVALVCEIKSMKLLSKI